ncbi:MAG: serine/threonine protein kinase, partial [Spirochaetota bacterium]
MNTLFYDLKPDIILAAVESAGFDPTGHCMALNSYENRVFDIRLADDSHIIVKFYRPGRWSREQIEEEHSFLFELQENDIPVCTPLHLAGGGSLRETEGILYAVWPRTGGRQRDEFTDVQLLMLGRLIARIHNTGAAKETVHRRTLDGDTYGRNVLSFLREHDFLPQSCEARYSDAVNRVADIYDNISKSVPYHRIHGDCHQGNLLSGTDGWFFLDFDDFVRGPAVQDLWMLLPVTSREGLRQRELLLDGYRTFRDFDQSWLRLIEPLRALRY